MFADDSAHCPEAVSNLKQVDGKAKMAVELKDSSSIASKRPVLE
jgi:hypothetical protein